MINFRRSPTAPATKRQAAHIDRLFTNEVIQSASPSGDAFCFSAIEFLRRYAEGTATQQLYADCYTLYKDWRDRP